jgi:hypothetical protein
MSKYYFVNNYNKLTCILACFLLCAGVLLPLNTLRASSPGMVEGPPGCDWVATVVSASTSKVTVRLRRLHGTCMQAPGNCGKEGDTFAVDTGDLAPENFSPGATVHIWVSSAPGSPALAATLKHPNCTRTPMTP